MTTTIEFITALSLQRHIDAHAFLTQRFTNA
jgi:hypothetical protein